jgi:hypothetical protein
MVFCASLSRHGGTQSGLSGIVFDSKRYMRICNIIICGNKRNYIKSLISFMAGWNFEMLGFNKKPLEKGRYHVD